MSEQCHVLRGKIAANTATILAKRDIQDPMKRTELCYKKSLAPEEAYRIGYKEKVDRKEKFPWNANIEDALHMQPEESLAFISSFFELLQQQPRALPASGERRIEVRAS
jgi:hypothetical protein